jgi:type I restriction enzyme, S subunit
VNDQETRPVAELCEALSGGTPSKQTPGFWVGAIPWVSPKDMKRWEIYDTEDHVSEAALAATTLKLVQPPAVLLVVRGMILAHTVPVAVSRVPLTVNQDMKALKPRAGVDAEYLAYMLKAAQDALLKEVEIAGHGTRRLKTSAWTSLGIPTPSIEEQRRIVTRIKELMSKVDEIETLRESAGLESGYLAAAVLGDLERSSSWPTRLVENLILDSQNGRSISESKQDGNGRVLTLTSVREVRLDLEYSKSIRLEEAVARQFRFTKGDVFVSRSNTRDLVGLSAVATADSPLGLIYPDLLIRLTVDRAKVLPDYLAYALRFPSTRRQIRERAKGTSQSMVKISGASLREVQIPVPDSLDEQREVLAALEARYSMARTLSRDLDSIPLVPLRQAILRNAFAGEL